MRTPVALLPLSAVFVSALTACNWGGCGDEEFLHRRATLSDDEMLALFQADTGLGVDDIDCEAICGALHEEPLDRCRLASAREGHSEVHCVLVNPERCMGGRMSESVRPRGKVGGTHPLGRALAAMAHDEWASAVAFCRLCAELQALGAPALLVQQALLAASDEERHGRVIQALAIQYGGRMPPLSVVPLPRRSLERMAHENVVEGTVRETFLAVRAWYQARHASEPSIRRAMHPIAVDETRHASLALAVDRWLRSRLDASARARLDLARDREIGRLRREQRAMDPGLRAGLGLPTVDRALRLIASLEVSLWLVGRTS
jgi:hypothetical protein